MFHGGIILQTPNLLLGPIGLSYGWKYQPQELMDIVKAWVELLNFIGTDLAKTSPIKWTLVVIVLIWISPVQVLIFFGLFALQGGLPFLIDCFINWNHSASMINSYQIINFELSPVSLILVIHNFPNLSVCMRIRLSN